MPEVLALIPARGGSKGLPRKNLRELCGRSLLAWSIAAARASSVVTRIVVSSDDREILERAEELGADVPFVRPASLAEDETPGVAVLHHAAEQLPEYDVIVVLQPTSPLRSREDVDGCARIVVDRRAAAAVTVTTVDKPPHWMYEMDEGGTLRPFLDTEKISRRQDAPDLYRLNGAVYAIRRPTLMESEALVPEGCHGYVMPAERSLDIDTELDLAFAEVLMSRRIKTARPRPPNAP